MRLRPRRRPESARRRPRPRPKSCYETETKNYKTLRPVWSVQFAPESDYGGEMTHHPNFGFNRCSWGFSPNRRNITTLWLFDCPYFFYSILRLGRTAGPIFTLYSSNDVFPRKDGPFEVRTMVPIFWGKYAQKTPPKCPGIGNFKPKRQKIEIAISPKL